MCQRKERNTYIIRMKHTDIANGEVNTTKILNNVDLEKISQTIENGKKDKAALRRPVKLQGEWILDSTKGYQFRTELGYEKGKQVVEIDSPSFLGGNGNMLGPMAYCITGITSCFIATLASVAPARQLS